MGLARFFGHVTFRRRQLRVGRDGELFDLEGVGVGDLLLEGVSWKTRDLVDRYLRNVRNVPATGTAHRQASANALRIVDEGQTYYLDVLFML